MLSAVAHKVASGHAAGLSDLLQRGCFGEGVGQGRCAGVYPFARYAVGMLHNGDVAGGSARVAGAMAHLEASVFGVLEHFSASLCLVRFSFGQGFDGAACACADAPAPAVGGAASATTAAAGAGAPPAATGKREDFGTSNVSLDEMR